MNIAIHKVQKQTKSLPDILLRKPVYLSEGASIRRISLSPSILLFSGIAIFSISASLPFITVPPVAPAFLAAGINPIFAPVKKR